MITYRSGEVVLANLSFISGTGSKRRPVLILLDLGDSDVIIAQVTSQSAQSRFEVALQEWQQSGLVQPSVVRVHKVTTIEKQALLRTLGALAPRDWAQVRARVKQLWAGI